MCHIIAAYGFRDGFLLLLRLLVFLYLGCDYHNPLLQMKEYMSLMAALKGGDICISQNHKKNPSVKATHQINCAYKALNNCHVFSFLHRNLVC